MAEVTIKVRVRIAVEGADALRELADSLDRLGSADTAAADVGAEAEPGIHARMGPTGGELLQFTYTNWRGDVHVYVIEPAGIEFVPEKGWQLHGYLVTRDGDARPDMGPTRRRSFRLARLVGLEAVDA